MLEPGFYNMDCMQGMAQFPDKFFDLAIVDPPYGDGNQKIGGGYDSEDGLIDTKWNRFGGRFNRYKHPNRAGKKLLRGTLPRGMITFENCSAFHAIKSSGAGTISNCLRKETLSCGVNLL